MRTLIISLALLNGLLAVANSYLGHAAIAGLNFAIMAFMIFTLKRTNN